MSLCISYPNFRKRLWTSSRWLVEFMDCGKNRLYSLKNDLRIAITVSEIPYWWSYNKNLVDIKLRVDIFSWVWRTERESWWPKPMISCNLSGSNSHIVPIEGITHSLNQSSPASPSSFLGPPDNTIINPAGLLQPDTQKSFPAVLRSFMSQRSNQTSPLLDWQKGLITSKLCVW